MVWFLVIVGGTVFYLISSTTEEQAVSPPDEVEMEVPTQENEGSSRTSLDRGYLNKRIYIKLFKRRY